MKKKEGKLIGTPGRFIRKDLNGLTTTTIGVEDVLASEHVADLLDLSTRAPVVSSFDSSVVKEMKEVIDEVVDVEDMTEDQKNKLMALLEEDLRGKNTRNPQVAEPLSQELCDDPRLVAWLEFHTQPMKKNRRGKEAILFRKFNVTGNTPQDFERAVKATKHRMGIVDDPTGKYLDEAIETGKGFYKGPRLSFMGGVRPKSTIHPKEDGFLEMYTAQDRFDDLMLEFAVVLHDSIMKNKASSHVLPRTQVSTAYPTSYKELSDYEWYMANLKCLEDEDGFIVIGDDPYPVLLDSLKTESEASFAWASARRDVTRQDLLRESALAPNQVEAQGGRSDSNESLVVDNVVSLPPVSVITGSEKPFQPLYIPDNSEWLAYTHHDHWITELYAEKDRVNAERALILATESDNRTSLFNYLEDLAQRGCPYEGMMHELSFWARQEALTWLRDKLECRRATSRSRFGESTVVTWEWARPVEYEFPSDARIQTVNNGPEVVEPAYALARQLTTKLLNARAVDPNNRLFGLIYKEVYRSMVNEADLVGPPEPVYVYDDLITTNGEPRALLRVTSSWKVTETGLWVPSVSSSSQPISENKASFLKRVLNRTRKVTEAMKKSNGKKLPIQLATEVYVPGLGLVMVPLALPRELQDRLNKP